LEKLYALFVVLASSNFQKSLPVLAHNKKGCCENNLFINVSNLKIFYNSISKLNIFDKLFTVIDYISNIIPT